MDVSKEGPVLWPDQYWEKSGYYHWYRFGSVRKDDDGFKMWYTSNDTGYNDFLLCYAESDDGIHWEKPDLGMIEYRGSTANNIVLKRDTWAGKSVWYNPISETYECVSIRRDVDPDRSEPHFSLIELASNSWMELIESDDGIHWDERSRTRVADTLLDCHHSPLYFNADGSSVIIARGPWEERPDGADLNRRMYRWEYDGSTFRNPTHVLDAPGWPEQQIYTMPTLELNGRYYGFAAVINVPVQRSTVDVSDHSDFNTVGCYLAMSETGDEWEWVSDEPLLPRGASGQWDSGQIYPHLSPVVVDDEVWLYYTGTHSRHGDLAAREPLVTNQGLARIPVAEFPSV